MSDYVKLIHDPDDENFPYTLMSYTLAVDLDVKGAGYGAQATVMDLLFKQNRELFDCIEWDSEYGCFFAYAKTEQDANSLKEFIDNLVEKRSPGAEPGNITDSPAFFEAKN